MSINVYRATSPRGKSYIGITSKTLEERKYFHFYFSDKGKMNPFNCAIRKYGKDSFRWEILEVVEDFQKAVIREEFFIKKFNSYHNGYNATLGGQTPNNLGRKHTIKTRMKVSQSLKGHEGYFKGKRLSLEHKRKLARAHCKPFFSVNRDSGEKKIWFTMQECMDALDLKSKGTLWACLKGKKKSYKNHIFGRDHGHG